MRRIGMLTSGGDCQALNAAMRGVVKALWFQLGGDQVEIYGFYNGYRGLIYSNYKLLSFSDFSGILTRGGTILGSSRTPFKTIREPDENGVDKVAAMKQNYYKLNLDCLVVLGGNGTTKTANLLREEGLNVITLPKTIDNDLWGTDMTFGFQSAVNIATNAIDCIHTTASSHSRVFIVEVMGHKVGWLTLNAGIAGGADIILVPEIPYDIDKIVDAINMRTKRGSSFTILAVAEGAISKERSKMNKKELKESLAKSAQKYPSVSYEIAAEIEKRTGQEIRVTVPGHTQRGGSPCPYDRVFASRLGTKAAELIINEDYGYMVGIVNREITKIPLEDVAGKLKYLEPDATIIKEARMLGISFGD
ncbi:MAG: 6-phosphofructokinase [Lachnospiraceae bacterium]|nr:6-phosphofructokinase [Lachnospiraceae bacterium]